MKERKVCRTAKDNTVLSGHLLLGEHVELLRRVLGTWPSVFSAETGREASPLRGSPSGCDLTVWAAARIGGRAKMRTCWAH